MSDAVLSQFTPPEREVKKVYDRKLRFGIIGTGWIAESHVECLKEMEDVEIAAGADLIPGKAEAFFKRYGLEGVHCYPDHKSMMEQEKLDAVCVCTYNTTHAECTIDALEKGIHVILEKPMCVTQKEAEDIIRAEKNSGRVLTLGFQPRLDENMKMIKKIVDSGELGKIYYIQTGGGRRRGIPNSTFIEKSTAGIGALGDIGCYSLDMVLNAVGYPKPLTVSGYTSSYFGPNPKYNNPKDAARFDVDDFAAAFVRLGGPMKLYKDVAGAQVEMEIPLCDGEYNSHGVFYSKLRAFIDAIQTGGRAPVPSEQILYNQAIIDAIVRSAALGREVEIQFSDIS